MNAVIIVHTAGSIDYAQAAPRQQLKAKLQIAGAAMGLIGGFGVGIFGGLLTAASWLSTNPAARHWLSNAGSTLLLLIIPFIILGAFCLDWLEKNQPQYQKSIALYDEGQQ